MVIKAAKWHMEITLRRPGGSLLVINWRARGRYVDLGRWPLEHVSNTGRGDDIARLARHRVLEDNLRREHRAIVAMSLALGGEERLLVISGPNTGGKTVALKTTGVAARSARRLR